MTSPDTTSHDITIHHCFLPHTGAEEALGFYREALGFEVINDVGEGDLMRWITIAPAGHPQTSIVLSPPAPDPTVTDQERATIAELMAKGSYGALTLSADDLDALFDRLVAAGAEVLAEPADQFYGVRDCAFRDPAGNTIRINQR